MQGRCPGTRNTKPTGTLGQQAEPCGTAEGLSPGGPTTQTQSSVQGNLPFERLIRKPQPAAFRVTGVTTCFSVGQTGTTQELLFDVLELGRPSCP